MLHIPLMFLSEWREFPSAPCLAEEKKSITARVSMLLKSRTSHDMLPFSSCNKKRIVIRHMNRPFFPMTISISPYDIGNFNILNFCFMPQKEMILKKDLACC